MTVALAAAFCCSCREQNVALPTISRAVQARLQCPSPDQSDYYFAGRSLDPRDDRNDGDTRRFVSAFLVRMKQSSLSCGSAPVEAYRLIRLGSADMPTAVTVARDDRGASIAWVQLSGPTWENSSKERVRGSARLSELDWTNVSRLADDVAFWSMDTVERRDAWPGPSTAWILEGRRAGTYHVVSRGYPRAGRLEELGTRLLQLTPVGRVELTPPR